MVKDSTNQTIVNKKVVMDIKVIKPNKIKENKDNWDSQILRKIQIRLLLIINID